MTGQPTGQGGDGAFLPGVAQPSGEGARYRSLTDGSISASTAAWTEVTEAQRTEAILLSQRKTHVKHRFTDAGIAFDGAASGHPGTPAGHAAAAAGGDVHFVCHTYYAMQFEALRRVFCGGDAKYAQSLSEVAPWRATGGKSGADFAKSADGRLVLKQVSRTELQMFLAMAPSYFEYMSKAFFHALPSALVKILGVYQVGVKTRWGFCLSYFCLLTTPRDPCGSDRRAQS